MKSIDDLPSDLISDQILSRLPIRDAVRTSVLSPGWRHRWKSISGLNFKYTRVAAIDSIFLQRVSSAPIRSFSLTDWHRTVAVSDTDRWLLSLSRSLSSLTLRFPFRPQPPRDPVSSHLFSFRSLQSLALTNCSIPPNSSSFPLLRILDLGCVDFPDEQCLQRLIANSPNLTHLNLSQVTPSPVTLIMENPNLRYFSFYTRRGCKSVVFAAAQALDKVDFNVRSNLFHSFPAGATCKGKLSLRLAVVERLAQDCIPHSVPTCFQNLRVLDMCMDFTNAGQIKLLLCLIRSAPNLQKLQIRVDSFHPFTRAENDFWNLYATCQLDCLRTVELTLYSFLEADVNFMVVVLGRASRLEKLIITDDSTASSSETSFAIQMLRNYQRASPQADIIYKKS